ncbi:hypothetical protein OMW55_09465 [Sphingomonas sp. BN140010]|uniref:Uncharacterized protein n=1 Tax=Sphingomonas arvum TaxID=2992113 RepID=A0ABT3JG24_9SPHN|nr:hypothetical protein [Sphingomonas sp. BN140010]MCW3798030.1 hypothetical protein [Sphingomonas sp. BN140010]
MNTRLMTGTAALALLVAATAPASAQVYLSAGTPTQEQPSDPRWLTCYLWVHGTPDTYVAGIYPTTVEKERDGSDHGWREYVRKKSGASNDELVGGCIVEPTLEDANWRNAEYRKPDPNHSKRIIDESGWRPQYGSTRDETGDRDAGKADGAPSSAAQAAADARAAREADYQRKVADYERLTNERARAQAEFERVNAENAQRQERQRAHAEAALQQHAREMAAAEQQQRQFQAAQQRYDKCLAGDKEACLDIAAGVPARPVESAAANTGTPPATSVSPSELAERKSNYQSIPVMGSSGASRDEAERKFLAQYTAKYPNRTNLTYNCAELWGRWVCRGTVESACLDPSRRSTPTHRPPARPRNDEGSVGAARRGPRLPFR